VTIIDDGVKEPPTYGDLVTARSMIPFIPFGGQRKGV